MLAYDCLVEPQLRKEKELRISQTYRGWPICITGTAKI